MVGDSSKDTATGLNHPCTMRRTKHGLLCQTVIFFLLAHIVTTDASSFHSRQIHHGQFILDNPVPNHNVNGDVLDKRQLQRQVLPIRGGVAGRRVPQQRNQNQNKQKKNNNNKNNKKNDSLSLDHLLTHYFGDHAPAPLKYLCTDLALEFVQIFFVTKVFSGEAKLFWSCHLAVQGILVLLTDYGAPIRTLNKLPYRYIAIYKAWFYFSALLHILSCTDGYPW